MGALLLCLLFSGCGRARDVKSDYAQERMNGSINGLEVFTDLLEKRGNPLKHYSRLSPGLKTQDVLIWFPDAFGQPRDEALWFLEDWLSRGPNRMVFFVGRDYDAGADYWSKVIKQTPPKEREIAARRLADARQRVDLARQAVGKSYKTPWFAFENSARETSVTSASGDWTQGVDFSKANVKYQSKLVAPPEKVSEDTLYDEEKYRPKDSFFEDDPNENATPPPSNAPPGGATTAPATKPPAQIVDNPFRVGRKLIDQGATPFAFELISNRFPGSRVFVIQNGRFLLNYGLTNANHRQLAQNLLQEIPTTAKVAILHSDADGPRVFWGLGSREKAKPEMVLQTTYVLLQISLPVLFLLFVLMPIFGRARELPKVAVSDFGKHIEAIGALLQKGNDERYAWSRVFTYQQQFKRDSGKRHAAQETPLAGKQIVIQIAAPAFGPGRAAELGTGQWLESTLAERNIGKVTSKMSHALYLEVQVAVQDVEFARAAIDAVLREGRLQDQATLFIR